MGPSSPPAPHGPHAQDSVRETRAPHAARLQSAPGYAAQEWIFFFFFPGAERGLAVGVANSKAPERAPPPAPINTTRSLELGSRFLPSSSAQPNAALISAASGGSGGASKAASLRFWRGSGKQEGVSMILAPSYREPVLQPRGARVRKLGALLSQAQPLCPSPLQDSSDPGG